MRMNQEQEQCLKGVAEPMGRFVPQDLLMAADGGVIQHNPTVLSTLRHTVAI